MEEIIKKWCETNSIQVNDAPLIIREYCKLYGNREVTEQEMQSILTLGNMIPITWNDLLIRIAIKNNWTIETLSKDGIVLYRYFYE